MHISVVRDGQCPPPVRNRQGMWACPLCAGVVKVYRSQVVKHLKELHLKRFVKVAGYNTMLCKLDDARQKWHGKGHYHCRWCSQAAQSRSHLITHLTCCKEWPAGEEESREKLFRQNRTCSSRCDEHQCTRSWKESAGDKATEEVEVVEERLAAQQDNEWEEGGEEETSLQFVKHEMDCSELDVVDKESLLSAAPALSVLPSDDLSSPENSPEYVLEERPDFVGGSRRFSVKANLATNAGMRSSKKKQVGVSKGLLGKLIFSKERVASDMQVASDVELQECLSWSEYIGLRISRLPADLRAKFRFVVEAKLLRLEFDGDFLDAHDRRRLRDVLDFDDKAQAPSSDDEPNEKLESRNWNSASASAAVSRSETGSNQNSVGSKRAAAISRSKTGSNENIGGSKRTVSVLRNVEGAPVEKKRHLEIERQEGRLVVRCLKAFGGASSDAGVTERTCEPQLLGGETKRSPLGDASTEAPELANHGPILTVMESAGGESGSNHENEESENSNMCFAPSGKLTDAIAEKERGVVSKGQVEEEKETNVTSGSDGSAAVCLRDEVSVESLNSVPRISSDAASKNEDQKSDSTRTKTPVRITKLQRRVILVGKSVGKKNDRISESKVNTGGTGHLQKHVVVLRKSVKATDREETNGDGGGSEGPRDRNSDGSLKAKVEAEKIPSV